MDFLSGALGGSSIGAGLAGTIESLVRGSRSYRRKVAEDQAKIQYRYQQMAADNEYRRQRDAFDYELDRNSASNQRRRLEEANLLGASLFEGAQPGTPSMGDPSTPSGPSLSPLTPNDSFEPLQDSLMQAAQIANINADTDRKKGETRLIDSQKILTDSKNLLAGLDMIGTGLKNSILETQSHVLSMTAEDSIESIHAGVVKLSQEIEKLRTENAYLGKEKRAAVANLIETTTLAHTTVLEKLSLINLNDANARLAVAYAAQASTNARLLARNLAVVDAHRELFEYATASGWMSEIEANELNRLMDNLRHEGLQKHLDAGHDDVIEELVFGSSRWTRALPFVQILGSMATFGVGGFALGRAQSMPTNHGKIPSLVGADGKPMTWMSW